MKHSRSLIIFAVSILLVLFFISSRRRVPFIPADALHKSAVTNDACTECHGPGKKAPLKESHPPKEQCLVCHRRA